MSQCGTLYEHSIARLEYHTTCTKNVYNIVDLFLTIFITIRSLIRNLTLATKVTYIIQLRSAKMNTICAKQIGFGKISTSFLFEIQKNCKNLYNCNND